MSSDEIRTVITLVYITYVFKVNFRRNFSKKKCTNVFVPHFTFIIFIFFSYCSKFLMVR